MNDILFEHVGKAYGGQQVLGGFSALLPAGGRLAVMGPSGIGKTTLVRLLLGLEVPDEGWIVGAVGQRFSCVFQEDRLCPGFSAADNVALVLPRSRWDAIDGILSMLGLAGEDLQKPVRELSGGQKRRVALARATEAPSDVLILDEAFKGLDKENKRRAFDYLHARLAGRTLLVITHDEEEVAALGAVPLYLT